jgi:hypothetical protein
MQTWTSLALTLTKATHMQALKMSPHHKGAHNYFFAMLMVGLPTTIFTTSALYSIKTHLEGNNIEI